VSELSPTAVWRISPDLVGALDERLGAPLDRYVNGTQTWLTPDGPGGATLEWRLHPVASFGQPVGVSHDDLWEEVVDEGYDAAVLWDGLECFPAYGDEVEPAVLAGSARAALGVAPDAVGLVDHDRIGRAWEQSRGSLSLVGLLLDELQGSTA
jgi:hypothetical protein